MKQNAHMKQFQPEKPDDRERRGSMTTQRCRTTQRITPWRRPHSGVGDHFRTAVAKYPTAQTEKQATISDMLLLSRVRGRDENSHFTRVDAVREPRDKHFSVRKRNQSSHTADDVVVTTVMRSPSIHREPILTKWRMSSSGAGGARGEPRSSKLPCAGAGGSDARRQRQHHSQKSQ